MSITVAILGLALLILIHEAGHFFVALAVGMSPRKFYIGFPPALVKVRRRGIEYGIGSIPLGGYVKIPGMHRPAASDLEVHFAPAKAEAPELAEPLGQVQALLAQGRFDHAGGALAELRAAVAAARLSEPAAKSAERALVDVGDALSRDAYWRQATWRKIAVIAAGPLTNLVFAVALLAVVLMLGVPVDTTRTVQSVLDGSPAQAVGLRAGDNIVAVGGRAVEPDRISATIRASNGRPLRVTVLRDGRRTTLAAVRPRRTDGDYRLGFALEPRVESYGPVGATELAVSQTWQVTKSIGSTLGGLVRGENRKDVSSAVGIVQGSSQAVDAGFRVYLQVLALISLSLALLNLLPLLPLDGGHITFSLIEAVRGRALGRAVYERASIVGLALVLFLFAIGLSNDIGRL